MEGRKATLGYLATTTSSPVQNTFAESTRCYRGEITAYHLNGITLEE